MATYGSFPGVKVTTEGGGIAGVQVGEEEKVILFGIDSGSGSAAVEDPTQIGARSEADTKFGDGSELSQAMKDALGNGANINFLYGVKVSTTAVTAESFTAASGTLANDPIVEDASTITVTEDPGGANTDITVQFRYDSAPSAPGDSDTVNINPITGEWTADASATYEFDYEYGDWSSALDAADTTVDEGETAIYGVLSEAESVASTLSSKVTSLRGNYQMAQGVMGAQPNANTSDNDPSYDTASYTDAIDDDAVYLIAPARKLDSTETIIGGVAGLMGGHAIDNPIYNDALNGFTDIEQKFTKTDADNMRDEQVIPIRQSGSIRVKDNLSTSTETDWERDFWRRRIVDRVILVSRQVGENTIGLINDEQTRSSAETTLFAEIAELVNDRLLKPNTSDTTNWFVDVYEDSTNTDEVNIDVGITPYGIAKRIDETITINT